MFLINYSISRRNCYILGILFLFSYFVNLLYISSFGRPALLLHAYSLLKLAANEVKQPCKNTD